MDWSWTKDDVSGRFKDVSLLWTNFWSSCLKKALMKDVKNLMDITISFNIFP